TEKLRQAAAAGSLRITANNDLAGGDPAPNQPKELHLEYKLGGEQLTKVVREGESLALGGNTKWEVSTPAKPAFRHLRIERNTAGKPMQVSEWQVFGSFAD
ncbi:MAG: hypothetical protein KDA90_23565, partial [Planctomycetaceae bacterium]|nr:hypothetical protein [Planctomycetaceae bacterium]